MQPPIGEPAQTSKRPAKRKTKKTETNRCI